MHPPVRSIRPSPGLRRRLVGDQRVGGGRGMESGLSDAPSFFAEDPEGFFIGRIVNSELGGVGRDVRRRLRLPGS